MVTLLKINKKGLQKSLKKREDYTKRNRISLYYHTFVEKKRLNYGNKERQSTLGGR